MYFFVISTIFSVIYYIKSEEQTTNLETAQNELDKWVGVSERSIGLNARVGSIPGGKSATALLVDDLDQLITAISGKPSDVAAQIKFDSAVRDINSYALPVFRKYLAADTNDPNNMSLVRVVAKLGQKLDTTIQQQTDLQSRYNQLFVQLEGANKSLNDTVASLNTQLEIYQKQVEQIKDAYAKLENELRQSTTQTEQNLNTRVKAAEAAQGQLKDELLKTQAILTTTSERMNNALQELEKIRPLPDSNALAYQPDGKVILYDPQTRIVHINLGSDDGVYRGLTFAVYDKDLPFPKDGKGKAEIEVYDVDKTISAARLITPVNPRNPVIKGDLIANLIWDKNQKYYFVVAGNFEQYSDGEKVKSLITKMGGNLEDSVSVNTDFIILGSAPFVLPKPTTEQIDLNPTAQEKYEASRKLYEHYRQVEQDARTFSIPILNFDRFLMFTGYKEQVTKPGAF